MFLFALSNEFENFLGRFNVDNKMSQVEAQREPAIKDRRNIYSKTEIFKSAFLRKKEKRSGDLFLPFILKNRRDTC